MKKTIVLISSLILATSLVSCGKDKTQAETDTTVSMEETTQTNSGLEVEENNNSSDTKTWVEVQGDDVISFGEGTEGSSKMIYHFEQDELKNIYLEITYKEGQEEVAEKTATELNFKVDSINNGVLYATAKEEFLEGYKGIADSKENFAKILEGMIDNN